jgi:hypothetical protein
MAQPDIQQRLAGMDDAFANTPVQTGFSDMPEDGDYQAVISRFDFFESSAGQLFLKTEMKVVHDAKYEGWDVSTVHNLEEESRLSWVKKHLSILGYEGSLSELPVKLHPFVGIPVAIRIKTSDKTDAEGNNYRNVYVNERLGAPIGPVSDVPTPEVAVGAGAPVDDDEEIPF